MRPHTPALLFLEKKKQKASDTLPLGKTSFCPCLAGVVRDHALWVLIIDVSLVRHLRQRAPLFRQPNRAEVFPSSAIVALVSIAPGGENHFDR